ncbi:MAG: hypothetical protein ACYCZO_10780 [Daejeonella sp.]
MKKIKRFGYVASMAIIVLITASCSTNSTKADDMEVKQMDSISNDLDKTNQELDEQAKKLEASLEKADKELNTSK